MASPTLTTVVVSALLVFVATAIVHAVVVPWAQARTRRREHWETSLSELSALVEDELRRALERYQRELLQERYLHSIRNHPEVDPQRFAEELRRVRDARRAANEALDGPMIVWSFSVTGFEACGNRGRPSGKNVVARGGTFGSR